MSAAASAAALARARVPCWGPIARQGSLGLGPMEADDPIMRVSPGKVGLREAGTSQGQGHPTAWEGAGGKRGIGATPEGDSKGPGPHKDNTASESLTATSPGSWG